VARGGGLEKTQKVAQRLLLFIFSHQLQLRRTCSFTFTTKGKIYFFYNDVGLALPFPRFIAKQRITFLYLTKELHSVNGTQVPKKVVSWHFALEDKEQRNISCSWQQY
jgi:hypothetical protein